MRGRGLWVLVVVVAVGLVVAGQVVSAREMGIDRSTVDVVWADANTGGTLPEHECPAWGFEQAVVRVAVQPGGWSGLGLRGAYYVPETVGKFPWVGLRNAETGFTFWQQTTVAGGWMAFDEGDVFLLAEWLAPGAYEFEVVLATDGSSGRSVAVRGLNVVVW